MKFYLVLMKCGHVGDNNYIPIWFPVSAKSSGEAKEIAKKIPRVKKHRLTDVLMVREVTFAEFLEQKKTNSKDVYLNITNDKDGYKHRGEYSDRIVTDYTNLYDKPCKPKQVINIEKTNRRASASFKLKRNKEIIKQYSFDLDNYDKEMD